ncbi:MAG: hypothetical protein ACTHJM_11870 [Marmoricola sp.]
MTLVPIDPKNEASVLTLLERAQEWLAEAVHRGEPGEVAAVKAQLATAAEATKQLNLSREIQLDAQEMVRRAEYALGKAIRRGQAEGRILAPGQTLYRPAHPGQDSTKVPEAFAHTTERQQVYEMADRAEPEEFDAAIDAAKAEGNLSRTNVVRKVRQQRAGVITRDMRAELIAQLAEQGYTSRQMPSKVGVTEESIRKIARDFDIEIPADKIVGRSRRIDWTDAVASTIAGLEDSVEFLKNQVDLAEVDFTEADEWVSSLTNSIAALNRFKQQIKEKTHV